MPSRRPAVTAAPALTSARLSAASISSQAGEAFMHRLSGQGNYKPDKFKPNSAFAIMSFSGRKMSNTYSAIKDECEKIGLKVTRVDENVGAGFILGEIVALIE